MRTLLGRRVREAFAHGVESGLSPKEFDRGSREDRKVCDNLHLLANDTSATAVCADVLGAVGGQGSTKIF